jgi:hypothetical protein
MKLVAFAIAALAIAQAPSVDAVLARLDEYLAGYEPKLSELIADEVMNQELSRSGLLTAAGESDPNRRLRVRRRLESEVAFISLPNDAAWLGFRHVKTVNNRPVALSESSLTSGLKSQGYEAAHALVQASAKHNLGLPRTTNLPNLPLEFLHRRNRSRLLARLDGRDRIRGVNTVRVVLLERVTPTLIRNPNTDADMPSVVRAWIDPASGQLLRADVNTFASFGAKEFENSLRVEFVTDKSVGVLVPSEMREEFPGDGRGTGKSVARYSNYRRFQTSARIVQ